MSSLNLASRSARPALIGRVSSPSASPRRLTLSHTLEPSRNLTMDDDTPVSLQPVVDEHGNPLVMMTAFGTKASISAGSGSLSSDYPGQGQGQGQRGPRAQRAKELATSERSIGGKAYNTLSSSLRLPGSQDQYRLSNSSAKLEDGSGRRILAAHPASSSARVQFTARAHADTATDLSAQLADMGAESLKGINVIVPDNINESKAAQQTFGYSGVITRAIYSRKSASAIDATTGVDAEAASEGEQMYWHDPRRDGSAAYDAFDARLMQMANSADRPKAQAPNDTASTTSNLVSGLNDLEDLYLTPREEESSPLV